MAESDPYCDRCRAFFCTCACIRCLQERGHCVCAQGVRAYGDPPDRIPTEGVGFDGQPVDLVRGRNLAPGVHSYWGERVVVSRPFVTDHRVEYPEGGPVTAETVELPAEFFRDHGYYNAQSARGLNLEDIVTALRLS